MSFLTSDVLAGKMGSRNSCRQSREVERTPFFPACFSRFFPTADKIQITDQIGAYRRAKQASLIPIFPSRQITDIYASTTS